jgi:hypothetical protein
MVLPVFGQRLNVAVLDLDPTGITEKDARFLSDRLRTEMFETGSFQVVEREKMEEILEEQGFQNTGCTSIECAVEIGQLLNVNRIIAGGIGKIEEIYSISLRMIDVESGAIVRTATEDYEGSLSEVLTEVIPQVAARLAEGPVSEAEAAAITEAADSGPREKSRYSLYLKYGLAIMGYTADLNEAIDTYRETTGIDLPQYSNHHNFALEGQYYLNEDWQIKLGFAVQTMYSNWQIDFRTLPDKFEEISLERNYRFVNWYIGANYNFWRPTDNYRWYIGYDIGITGMESSVKQAYTPTVGDPVNTDDVYTYNNFTLKLDLGLEYQLSRSLVLGAELGTQIIGEYDLSNEKKGDNFPEGLEDIVFPAKINPSALRVVIFVAYIF